MAACVYVRARLSVCLYRVCIYISSIYLSIYLSIYIYIHIHIYVSIYIYIHIHIYIYIYVYTHIYIHIHTHTDYTCNRSSRQASCGMSSPSAPDFVRSVAAAKIRATATRSNSNTCRAHNWVGS